MTNQADEADPASTADLHAMRHELDALRRDVDTLLRGSVKPGTDDAIDGLQHGAAALEAAGTSAFAVVIPRAWLDETKRWIRDAPLVSVLGSLAAGWTLASALRR